MLTARRSGHPSALSDKWMYYTVHADILEIRNMKHMDMVVVKEFAIYQNTNHHCFYQYYEFW